MKRSAGVLMHIGALPGNHGIGDLGSGAYRFVDWLKAAGQTWWQILPFNALGYTNQPYQSPSSWAGAYEYISLDEMVKDGFLTKAELGDCAIKEDKRVVYEKLRPLKQSVLRLAADKFFAASDAPQRSAYEAFCKANKWWLEDWAIYSAIKESQKGRPWWEWEDSFKKNDRKVVKNFVKTQQSLLDYYKFTQFIFELQWQHLRDYAKQAGIGLIGDIPIYCSRDSHDVWASIDHFNYNAKGELQGQAGVPPDYFNENGQLWGMPTYNWKTHKAENFKWWMGRLRGALGRADVVRIDHFRALSSYYDIPAKDTTAKNGKWKKGPGDDFFKAVKKSFGNAPFIAEDLGDDEPAVFQLRDRWNLPGMRVLQFAFGGGSDNPHLPHNYIENCVVYPGTHDNDTALGWYKTTGDKDRKNLNAYAGKVGNAPQKALIRLAYTSVAAWAIVPMQDILDLPSYARLNFPGDERNPKNYRWKMVTSQFSDAKAKELAELAAFCRR